MTPRPALDLDRPRGDVQALALVLHGGRARSTTAVRPTNLTVLRMAPFAQSLRRAGRGAGLAVARLRYVVRGWNGAEQSPVGDVRWALDELGAQLPDVPVALVGHSMGGRAAVYAAGHPSVRAVVGLAPWLEPGDPYEQVAGRHVLVAHGDLDRMTNAAQSAAWTRRARAVAASASYVSISNERHAMLRRAQLWHALTTAYVLAVMCDTDPGETSSDGVANLVSKILAGDPSLVV